MNDYADCFVANTYNESLTFKVEWLFYNKHFDSSDIKFTGIIVNFMGVNKWILLDTLGREIKCFNYDENYVMYLEGTMYYLDFNDWLEMIDAG